MASSGHLELDLVMEWDYHMYHATWPIFNTTHAQEQQLGVLYEHIMVVRDLIKRLWTLLSQQRDKFGFLKFPMQTDLGMMLAWATSNTRLTLILYAFTGRVYLIQAMQMPLKTLILTFVESLMGCHWQNREISLIWPSPESFSTLKRPLKSSKSSKVPFLSSSVTVSSRWTESATRSKSSYLT